MYVTPLAKKKDCNVFVGGGLVSAIGVFGKFQYALSSSDGTGTVYNQAGENKRPFQGEKKLDLGINMLAGIAVKKIQFQLSYNYGVLGLSSKAHNRSVAISLGYLL